MKKSSDNSDRLKRSWSSNAQAWTQAVRDGQIESRRLVTDQALLDALTRLGPRRVLDVGCGEGWLARVLAEDGAEVVGVDASPELIDAAAAQGGGQFHVLSYEEIAREPSQLAPDYDAVICNFSLLEEDIGPLLRGLHTLTRADGALLVQTVHPWTANGPYEDGWRTETFDGFGEGFSEPMPWYFRTLGSWVNTLRRDGFEIDRIDEPRHPRTGTPASLLIVLTIAR